MTRQNNLYRSAIILAGGFSSRFGTDKGTIEFNRKLLIEHVIDAVIPIVDETIIVTNSQERKERYSNIITAKVQFAVDNYDSKGPLVGALTGFGTAQSKYSLLLPFDTPFISRVVVLQLFELCLKTTAVIPRWPNGNIEPLQAVYETNMALAAAKLAIEEGKLNLRSMIEKLNGVRYVSTLVFQQIDPNLRIFFNINNVQDLKSAENMIKRNF